ncbi:MAG: rRNA maturation RNase YbeY [Psychrilyobacter sp.]|uniref:rRNA maturation RNase YbeY n=1 Tax=Psychrilyobacter sp. TaxID=2586924 RepID=UPI003C781AA8
MEIIVELTKGIDGYDEFIDLETVEDYIKTVIEDEYANERDVYMSLLLTNNENIQIVNRDYRGKDQPTDVISFAYLDTEDDFQLGPYLTLGDIVISLERVKEQAGDYNHSFKREFYYVLTHGILHLLGYDHIEDEDKKIMRKKEEEILNTHGYSRDI